MQIKWVLWVWVLWPALIIKGAGIGVGPFWWSHSSAYSYGNLQPDIHGHPITVFHCEGPYFVGVLSNKTDTKPIQSNTRISLSDPFQTENTSRHRVARFNGFPLRYILYQSHDSGVPLSDIRTAISPLNVLSGSDASTPQRHRLYLSVLPEQLVPPGIYQDVVTLELYQGTLAQKNSATYLLETSFPIYIPIGRMSGGQAITPTTREFYSLESSPLVGVITYKKWANFPHRIHLPSSFQLKDSQSDLTIPYEVVPTITPTQVTIQFKVGINPNAHHIVGVAEQSIIITLIDIP